MLCGVLEYYTNKVLLVVYNIILQVGLLAGMGQVVK